MEKRKILIVDDEKNLTRMVKLNLEKTGKYIVREENSGDQVLSVVRDFQPHLVILDIVMPDIEGSFIASQIKNEPDLKHIPIIFLTAAVFQEELKGTRGMIGGYPFLAKPVDTKQLLAVIE